MTADRGNFSGEHLSKQLLRHLSHTQSGNYLKHSVKRRHCLKSPPGQYDQCMAEHSQSYREYQQQREKALQQPEQPKSTKKPLKANKKDSENK